MMRRWDATWMIDDIVADGLLMETPTVQAGRTVTLDLWFDSAQDIATESVSGRYNRLLEYFAYQNEDNILYGTSNGVPYYRETLNSHWDVDSLVVPVEPGEDVIDARGFWALVTGGDDTSKPVPDCRQVREVSVDVFVLATLDEYDSRDALEADLGTEVVDGV